MTLSPAGAAAGLITGLVALAVMLLIGWAAWNIYGPHDHG